MSIAFLYGVGAKPATLITKTVTANGTYTAADDNADGYSAVTVNVPNKLAQRASNTLTDVTAEDLEGVTSITPQAFFGLTALRTIVVPASVTNIGAQAFASCRNARYIRFLSETPPALANSNALGDMTSCPIQVPAAGVNAYKTATNWSTWGYRVVAIPTT